MNGYSVRTEDGVCFVSKTRKGRVVPVPLPHSPGPPACTNEPLRFTQQRCNCIRNPIFSIKIRDTVSKSRLRTAIRLNPLFEFLEFRVYRYRGSFFFLDLFIFYFRLSVSVLSLLVNQDSPFVGLCSPGGEATASEHALIRTSFLSRR